MLMRGIDLLSSQVYIQVIEEISMGVVIGHGHGRRVEGLGTIIRPKRIIVRL